MKKFILSILLGSTWGLLCLSQPQWIPGSVTAVLQPLITKSYLTLHQLQMEISKRGLEFTLNQELEALCIGALTFLCTWIFLTTFLGIKGFSKDLFAFFPLGK